MRRTSSQNKNQAPDFLSNILSNCGLSNLVSLEDFVKFASFYSVSQAYGSNCSDSLKRDAKLAMSLLMSISIESQLQASQLGNLNEIGICTIAKKIAKLIKKCCSHPDFFSVLRKQKEKDKQAKGKHLTIETKNERLGLTPESDLQNIENIKLDLTYIPNCSNVREMIPGNNNLGNRVTGITHSGKNIPVNRDTCLISGKIWNTINSTCYCIDEKQTPHLRYGDTKIRKDNFHLGPPRNWSKVTAITQLNLDKEARERFEDIIAHKEGINLDDLQKTKCGEEDGCVWYSCLIEGITNYFLGCKKDKTGKINSCYFNRNLLKSTRISSEDKSKIMTAQQKSIERCCDKCYESGCGCKDGAYGCECTGVSSNGVPCSQITARSAQSLNRVTEGDPILKTNNFNSDSHIMTGQETTVTCCGASAQCPPDMTDADCCRQICKEIEIQDILRTDPKSISRVRNNDTHVGKHIGGTCTCKKCGAQAKVANAQACQWWLSTHKETCNPPTDDSRSLPETCNKISHKNFTIADMYDFKITKDIVSYGSDVEGCCRGNDGGCCTCYSGKLSWPCCCSGTKEVTNCCHDRIDLKITTAGRNNRY
tara:strand:- start:1495 stop:3276 length:1782 start_codon:yes stop_codon:yes gene_type:complete